jgi:hypothetical protein
MVLSRNTWLALVLAAALAGCGERRWLRPSCAVCPPAALTESAPEETRPVATRVASASLTPPEYLPALYIPGSAEITAPKNDKSDKLATLPMRPAATTSETTLPALRPRVPEPVENPLHTLQRKAVATWSSLEVYACRMRRREVVAGQQKPEEVIHAKFRKEPFSVYFQWVGAEGKGREVVYVQGQHGNVIHTLTAAGDVFLMPAGTRFKIAPDSLLVKNKSRYPITDAGVGSLVARFTNLVEALDRGDPRSGAAKYLGQVKRKEFETKVEVVLQTIAPGRESQLPQGGQRLWCFDPEHSLPVLIVTHDETNREVEYYCHDRFEFPGRFPDDDFHPDRLWQKSPQRVAAD